MPCDCDGYPEPSLAQQLEARERLAKERYDKLYQCHQEVVAERDSLRIENDKLRAALVDKAISK